MTSRCVTYFIILCLTAVFATGLFASEDKDRVFEKAKRLWLTGNDRESLPLLSKLAKSGNVNARLLLGRIETSDLGHSTFRRMLSGQDARRLFRKTDEGSRFGRTWLAVEAENGNTLAKLFLQSRKPEVSLDLIRALHAVGEVQASDHPTRILALYGRANQKQSLLSSSDLISDLKPYLTYLLNTSEPRSDGLEALRHMAGPAVEVSADDRDSLAMAETLALGHWFGDYGGENSWRASVANWLLTAPSAMPIARLCSACESTNSQIEPASCALTFMALLGGYYEVIRVDSPVETLISQNAFLNSKRAQMSVLRRASLMRNEIGTDLASLVSIQNKSMCAARMIDKQRIVYRDAVARHQN